MSFQVGQLLWHKLEGYPWWPCQALGPDNLEGYPVPESITTPLAILYLGSNEMAVVENALDEGALVPFDPSDEQKCFECAGDETLTAALDAATLIYNGATANGEDGAASSSDEDDNNEDGAAGGDDDLLIGGGDDGEALRRKKEKKEKKEKKSKKEKKDKKKDKKHRRDEDDGAPKKSSSKSAKAEKEDLGRREKKHRAEKKQKFVDTVHANGEHIDNSEEDAKPVRFEKIDVDDNLLVQLKDALNDAVEEKDRSRIRDYLSDLSKINVTFEQLVSTGIGHAVGAVADVANNKGWGEEFAPLQAWAETIIRFWFAQIPARHKDQLIDAGEVDHASVASNEDAGSDQNDFAALDALGLQIEKAFTNDEVMLGGDISAAEIALAIQLAIEKLDVDHKAQRGAEVLHTLSKADHSELRLKLLRNEIAVDDFVHNPINVGMNTQEKQRLEDNAHEAEKAMDITGERERIVHAIAVAEVVEK